MIMTASADRNEALINQLKAVNAYDVGVLIPADSMHALMFSN